MGKWSPGLWEQSGIGKTQAMTKQGRKKNKSIKAFNQCGEKEKGREGGDCSRRPKIHVTKVHFYKSRRFSFLKTTARARLREDLSLQL